MRREKAHLSSGCELRPASSPFAFPDLRTLFRALAGQLGNRGLVPRSERDGRPVRPAGHDRAVAVPPARAARPQLPAKVNAAKEQMADQARQLTSRKATKTRPPASGSRPKRGGFPVRTLGILIRMPLPAGWNLHCPRVLEPHRHPAILSGSRRKDKNAERPPEEDQRNLTKNTKPKISGYTLSRATRSVSHRPKSGRWEMGTYALIRGAHLTYQAEMRSCRQARLGDGARASTKHARRSLIAGYCVL